MGLHYWLSTLMGEQARSPKAGTFLGWLARKGMRANEAMAKNMLQLSNPKDGAVFVELGPGNGFILEHLFETKNPSRVYGIEISDAFRDFLEEKFAAEIKLAAAGESSTAGRLTIHADDAKSLPFIQDSSVDYIYAMNVIYFLDPLEVYLPELYRILKPGGEIVWGIDKRAEDNDPNYFHNLSWDKCVQAMKDAKFENATKDETYVDEMHIFLKATK